MDGRALLDVSRELAAGPTEAHWRSSVGRSYYALLHIILGSLGRWGFAAPPRDKVHTFARLKFVYAADPDLKRIGLTLEALAQLRNVADYQLGRSGTFASARVAASALADAESAIALLDALESDPARRAAAARTIPP
jgi:hypothetical protein